MNTIESHFEEMMNMVAEPGIQPRTYMFMRRTFYAGAMAILKMQLELNEKDISDSAKGGIMLGWVDEVDTFRKQIKRGEA